VDDIVHAATCLTAVALAVSVLPFDLYAQSGGYRTTRNGQELAAEVYHWSGRTLEATADVPVAGHRIATRTVYDSAYEPLSYDLRLYALATGAEQRVVHVTFGDSVRWTVEGQPGGGARALPPPRAVMRWRGW
jgi:hypothetical protein